MKNFYVLTIFLFPLCLLGQIIGDEEIDTNKLTSWNTSEINTYAGVYFFGFSESESKLFLSVHDSIIDAQLQYYSWNNGDEKIQGWIPTFKNYTNVQIIDNKFYSKESNGEFVVYENRKYLKLDNPPLQEGEEESFYELGALSDDDYFKFISGDYNDTKFTVLPEKYLKSLSSKELKIVRNEIYARYGYIFNPGGEMSLYFNSKEWYKGIYKNVDKFITQIEKRNIAFIKKAEEIRKQ